MGLSTKRAVKINFFYKRNWLAYLVQPMRFGQLIFPIWTRVQSPNSFALSSSTLPWPPPPPPLPTKRRRRGRRRHTCSADHGRSSTRACRTRTWFDALTHVRFTSSSSPFSLSRSNPILQFIFQPFFAYFLVIWSLLICPNPSLSRSFSENWGRSLVDRLLLVQLHELRPTRRVSLLSNPKFHNTYFNSFIYL